MRLSTLAWGRTPKSCVLACVSGVHFHGLCLQEPNEILTVKSLERSSTGSETGKGNITILKYAKTVLQNKGNFAWEKALPEPYYTLGRRAFIQFYSLPHPKSFLYYLRGEIKAKKHCCKSQLRDIGPLNDWDLIINWKKLLPYLATIPRGIGVTVVYSEKSCITKTLSKWE